MANIHSVLTVLLIAINALFVEVYHENVGIAGLHYIAFGLGLYIGAQISNFGLDRIHKALAARKKTRGRPEFRLREFTLKFFDIVLLSLLLIVRFASNYDPSNFCRSHGTSHYWFVFFMYT